jgi:hypothetical protein
MYVAAPQWSHVGQPCHNILQKHKTLLIRLESHRTQPSWSHKVPEVLEAMQRTKCQNFPKPNLSCTSTHKSYMLRKYCGRRSELLYHNDIKSQTQQEVMWQETTLFIQQNVAVRDSPYRTTTKRLLPSQLLDNHWSWSGYSSVSKLVSSNMSKMRVCGH